MVIYGLWQVATQEGIGASPAAKVTALMGISKFQGYIVDRREVTGRIAHSTHVTHAVSGLSHEQLMAIVEGYRQETKALESGAEAEIDEMRYWHLVDAAVIAEKPTDLDEGLLWIRFERSPIEATIRQLGWVLQDCDWHRQPLTEPAPQRLR